jgi:antitoxin YefM
LYHFWRGSCHADHGKRSAQGTLPLIKKVNEDHDAIEIVSKHGNAVLVSAKDYAALREGAYLLRSPANARRLLKAYENALNGMHVAEHDLIDPDGSAAR